MNFKQPDQIPLASKESKKQFPEGSSIKNALSKLTPNNIGNKLSLLVFLAPTLIFVVVFLAYPIIYSGYLSFTEYNFIKDDVPTFIGVSGYVDTILHDTMLHTALQNQLRFAIPYSLISFSVSLGLAIIVNELTRGTQFFQVLFYLPMIIPISLVGITFAWILQSHLGVFNHILRSLGFLSRLFDWFGNPDTALYSLVVARSWKMIGFTFIIFGST